MPRRLLAVITSEVADGVLRDLVRSRAGDDAEMLVVAPAAGISRLDWLTNVEDDARASAFQSHASRSPKMDRSRDLAASDLEIPSEHLPQGLAIVRSSSDLVAVAEEFMVFVVAALPGVAFAEVVDELDLVDPFDVFEAELVLDPQP